MDSSFFKVIAVVADFITIVLFTYGLLFAIFRRTRSVIGFQVNQFMIKSFRLGVIMSLGILSFQWYVGFFQFVLVSLQGSVGLKDLFWEEGKEFTHIVAYITSLAIMLPIFWMVATMIWTFSFKYIIDFVNIFLPAKWRIVVAGKPALQILHAEYGSDTNRIDVTDRLRVMVINNSLTITASNNLAGDPHFGVIKTLTIEYRFGNKVYTEKILESNTKKIP
jgi:hypothetical protein